jgi:hypothetical protein
MLSGTICITKLNPKPLSYLELDEFISIHYGLNSTEKLIQFRIRFLVSIIKSALGEKVGKCAFYAAF